MRKMNKETFKQNGDNKFFNLKMFGDKPMFTFLKRLLKEKRNVKKHSYSSTIEEALEKRDYLNEDVVFRSFEITSPTVFHLTSRTFGLDEANISLKAIVRNKFRAYNPLTDLVDSFNSQYEGGAVVYLDDRGMKKLKLNMFQVPFDVEEIILVASIESSFFDSTISFSDFDMAKLYMEDFHSKDEFYMADLKKQIPNANGYVIGSLVRGYVVRENYDWVFLSADSPIRNEHLNPVRVPISS